jgi:hypothetical protein
MWIGGGQKWYRGDSVNDIWKYDGETWAQVQTVRNNQLNPISIGSGVRAASFTNLNDRVCAIVIDKNNKYHKLKKSEMFENEEGKKTQPFSFEDNSLGNPGIWAEGKTDKYALITRSFNGCIWLISKEKKLNEVVTSNLFYSAPE